MILILSFRATNLRASRIRKMASFVTMKSRICWRKQNKQHIENLNRFELKTETAHNSIGIAFIASKWLTLFMIGHWMNTYNSVQRTLKISQSLSHHLYRIWATVSKWWILIGIGWNMEHYWVCVWKQKVEVRKKPHLLGIRFVGWVCSEPNSIEHDNTN